MKDKWTITTLKDIKSKNAIFIEGLPGLGNVGKIVADTLVEQLDAQKIGEFFSYSLPNSVFVTEENLVELPKIELYYKKIKNQSFLFLTGDVQPLSEESSYRFTEKVLDLIQKYGCSKIITLGGIGINDIPKKPKVFCTGNHSGYVSEFGAYKVDTKIFGVVGPIMGVSGLLLGLSKQRKLPAASLLAETYGHPMYVGLRGAKEILKVLMKKYGFQLNLRDIDKEIKELEEDLSSDSPKGRSPNQPQIYKDMSYIG
ncbi:MAG: PAC2 family protein [Nanoarchaeota archaeon]|nr:PAC2 family protein [Nanoarchaeota archaeon]MBU1029616.1 PAC2 family protein [Nanoarchaeota archaeon]MBU1850231.1 PAC2 family protein [Nanoarchaeota archaeon]